MADLHRPILVEREVEQALTALKKGAYLLKYGRRGKPKFCPFRLSPDESTLIWYNGKEEKQLELRHVTKIIPGQRTAIFQRYPRPEKEYQSFSLLCNDRSLDLICKDKDEAEVWFLGLKALISFSSYCNLRTEARSESISPESPKAQRISLSSPSSVSDDILSGFLGRDGIPNQGDTLRTETLPHDRLGKAFADIVSITSTTKTNSLSYSLSSVSSVAVEHSNGRTSASDAFRISLSSAVSSSSLNSCNEDIDNLGDVYIWGEGTGDGVLGGGELRTLRSPTMEFDSHLPKALESTMLHDVRSTACGNRHAVLVTKQGEIFSWGEGAGGRLGHGVEADISHPKLVDTLSGMNIEMVACGESHTCAITLSGDLYTWGNGTHNSGLLGHGSDVSYWIPKKVGGLLEGLQVSYVSCGPWHTALITSGGQLFTFGDGTFGALGNGYSYGASTPREVEALKGLRTLRVACGVWHTAAVVEIVHYSFGAGPSDSSSSGKLFTWGNGDKGQLGHGDNKSRLVPELIASLVEESFSQVACGDSLTVALTTSGRIYTMGSTAHGQLGTRVSDGRTPACIEGNTGDGSVEEISCGSHHVAVLTSKSEVYTWGKNANGQLGLGHTYDRNTPTLVESLKDKQVKSIVCGSNFTAVVCLHKSASGANNSVCSGCHNPFNFIRHRHNCYNCGLVFCNACSSRKSLKASLAPSRNKPYRVCDDCFTKLQKATDSASAGKITKVTSENALHSASAGKITKVTSENALHSASAGKITKVTSENALHSASARKITKVRSENTLRMPPDIAEKESGSPRSRLSFVDSFNMSGGRGSKSIRVETNNNWGFSLPNGNTHRGSISSAKSSSRSIPSSRMVSRSTSTLLRKGSPQRSATAMPLVPGHKADVMLDESKHNHDSLSEEIKYLRTQVEELASKTQLLEAELAKKSRELKEATAVAAEEAEKNKAAKEVIKSLSEEFKEMTDQMPEESIGSSNSDYKVAQKYNNPSRSSNGSSSTSVASSKSGSTDGSTASVLSNGTKAQVQTSELVLQDEPGVYLTLKSFPGGGNELRRVRFSRKRFTEEQAERWWAENGTKVCQRHNVLIP